MIKKIRTKRRVVTDPLALKLMNLGPAAGAHAAFNALVGRAQIRSVDLAGVEAKVSPKHLKNAGDKHKAEVAPPEFRAQFLKESSALYCGVRLLLEVGGAGKTAGAVVSVRAEYSLVYHIPEDVECTHDGAMLFASRNAVFNAWPYFRELAQSLVARMGMPPVIIPLLRLPVEPPSRPPPQSPQPRRVPKP